MSGVRILPMRNPDEFGKVAETILERALENPEARAVIDALIEDPKPTRKELFHTAFAMGVASALGEMIQGNVVQIGENMSHSDS